MPLDMPPPLDQLLLELARTRHSHARIGSTQDQPWLFPGGRPGTHLTNQRLTVRLNQLGLAVCAGRNTTLMDLAAQLPAAVLGQLLGLSPDAATAWAHDAGAPGASYAAELARRTQRREDPAPGG